jgi:tetratricopeptide (TPR) repeat protein
MSAIRRVAGAALLAATLPHAANAQSVQAQTAEYAPAIIDRCLAATCVARLTAPQLLAEVEKLVAAGRYDEARPMLAALEQVPALRLETRFLSGLVAAQSGDHARAIGYYKAILADDPNQTRVRVELARSMLAMGKPQSADRQFKLAQQDDELPPEVARTIRTVRDIIRQNRAWRLDVNVGFAPDTNINNATSFDSITILWGGVIPVDLALDENARARSGIGQTATVSGGVRLPVGDGIALISDLDATGTNYGGVRYDDYQAQLAAGAEVRLSSTVRASLQALGAQRWYAGDVASRQAGAKAGLQLGIGDRQRVGLQFDGRRTDALFDDGYDGWQLGAYASYERALSRSIVASVGVFGRRDWLDVHAYSNKEYGASLGLGGELPMGFNAGISGTVSRATYDAPMYMFSWDPRHDMRYTARATLGNRKVAWQGFSPEVTVAYTRNDSSIRYFTNDRLRVRVGFARYF